MRRQAGMARLDRPWHRPGAVWYALRRLPGLLRPPVSVYEPAAGSLSVLRDLPVVVRDGTTVRVNVVLPAGAGRFPVLMSAHPYSKDNLPQRRSRGYRVSFQYRMLRQPAPVRFSVLTGWEAPDPAWWAARGYAALRSLDEQNSRPFDPVPTLSHRQPLPPGQAVPADIALGPSATLFRAGETLRLVVAGRWLWPRNPLTGNSPPPTRRARKANAPCTGDRNTKPAFSFPSSPDRSALALSIDARSPMNGPTYLARLPGLARMARGCAERPDPDDARLD